MEGEFEGERYRIVFQHGPGYAPLSKRCTRACVEEFHQGQWESYCAAKALCSVDDTFKREVGRKLALMRAIAHQERSFRAFIWSLYNGRKTGGAA
jgi:hypothetical protein